MCSTSRPPPTEGAMVARNNSTLPPIALVMGDPARVRQSAELVQGSTELWLSHGFLGLQGSYRGHPIVLCSHGVGASGASLVFEKLFQSGVKYVIRAGTCGSMSPDVRDGSLVIATAAIRDDGTSQQILPIEFPALADHRIVDALQLAAQKHGHPEVHSGIVWSSGVFYHTPFVPSREETWTKAGAIAGEMELALLFVMASYHGAAAGGILAVEGGTDEDLDPWSGGDDRDFALEATSTMLEIALDALVSIHS